MILLNDESKVSFIQTAIAGGTAGAVTRAICQPFDVLKIRFQLQIEPISQGSKYSSLLQAINSIVKEEGLAALWSGHVPAQILSISYGVIQFSSFEKLSHLFQVSQPQFYEEHQHGLNFFNGAISSSLATIISFPFDTVRTRLIAEEKTKKAYKGFINALHKMIRKEGPTSLYKGLTPTLCAIAPHTGVQFAVYKFLSGNIMNKIQIFQRESSKKTSNQTTLLGNLISGSLAGLASKVIIYPCDLVKKRLQIQGFQQYRTSFGKQIYCSGMFDCIKLTLTNEGFFALYKGFAPSVLKAIVVSALNFSIYDEVKHLILRIQL